MRPTDYKVNIIEEFLTYVQRDQTNIFHTILSKQYILCVKK